MANGEMITLNEVFNAYHNADQLDYHKLRNAYERQGYKQPENTNTNETKISQPGDAVETHADSESESFEKRVKKQQEDARDRLDDDLKFHDRAIRKILYRHNIFRRVTGNPSYAGGIAAYTYLLEELSQTEREAFAKKYTVTFTKVMENLPADFLNQEGSGFVIGILDFGAEQEKLLEKLEDTETWKDPALLRLILSMIFQAYDKPQGFSNQSVLPNCKLTLNNYFKQQYTVFQTDSGVMEVLRQFHISADGYVPVKVESGEKEYNFIRLIRGGVKGLNNSTESKGVALSFIGLTSWMTKKRPELKGFALDDFQKYAGGALGGVQFGDGQNAGSAKLDFSADFKAGNAHIHSDNLPFENINYLSDSFAFKTDNGYFKNVNADFDWPAKKEDAEGIGKITVNLEDMVMNNMRIIFPDETYGLSKIQLKGLSMTVYQNFGSQKDMNTSSELLDKFISVFYDLSQLITYALQLCVHRFSSTTGEDAGQNLAEVLRRSLLENVGMQIQFDSLDIDNLLLIDNDFPAGKTIYPVDASQEFTKHIHLGKTNLSIQSTTAQPEIDVYEKIVAIEQKAKAENRPLTLEEQESIAIERKKIAEVQNKRRANTALRRKESKLVAKNEENGESEKRNKKIEKIKNDS
ncbi:MAG: hypothetical protein ACRCYO_03510, partial [Bacteroidia bacterium]